MSAIMFDLKEVRLPDQFRSHVTIEIGANWVEDQISGKRYPGLKLQLNYLQDYFCGVFKNYSFSKLQVIKKAQDDKTKPKVQDFGSAVEDSSFLNALQTGVNRWIREIQKVKLHSAESESTF